MALHVLGCARLRPGLFHRNLFMEAFRTALPKRVGPVPIMVSCDGGSDHNTGPFLNNRTSFFSHSSSQSQSETLNEFCMNSVRASSARFHHIGRATSGCHIGRVPHRGCHIGWCHIGWCHITCVPIKSFAIDRCSFALRSTKQTARTRPQSSSFLIPAWNLAA